MKYRMHVQELDEGTYYPILVLSGMTGLSQKTIKELAANGYFQIQSQHGEEVIHGKEFLEWANRVNHVVEVEKTEMKQMPVDKTE